MLKRISIIIVLLLGVYFLVTIYTIESDPCDVKCDNCVNLLQCEECYNDCYSTLK